MILGPEWCNWIGHKGHIISCGRIEVTGKKNLPDGSQMIPGRWWIRKCKRCGEQYSTSFDLVDKRSKVRGVVDYAMWWKEKKARA